MWAQFGHTKSGEKMKNEKYFEEMKARIAQSFEAARGPQPTEPSQADKDAARMRWEESVGGKYEALIRIAMRKV